MGNTLPDKKHNFNTNKEYSPRRAQRKAADEATAQSRHSGIAQIFQINTEK